MIHTPDFIFMSVPVQFTVLRMDVFPKAFLAFDQNSPAKIEIKGKGKPVRLQAYYRLRGFQ
jgi:hypothetical protein